MTHYSKPRLYPGLINHVILRSLDDQCLFREAADRDQFLYYLRESIKSHDLHIYAYALMEEHIHLVFRTSRDPSDALYLLKRRYTLYYKRKYRTGKALFRNLFKAETSSDPVSLVCFILRDPVRQGLVSDPFTSCHTSIGIFRGEDLPVDREALLALAGEGSWRFLLSRPQSLAFMEYCICPGPEESRLILGSICSPEEKESFHDLPPDRKKQILGQLRSCGVTYSFIRESFCISKYEIDLALGRIRKVRDAPDRKNGR